MNKRTTIKDYGEPFKDLMAFPVRFSETMSSSAGENLAQNALDNQ